jgi:hypothetical protein
MPISLAQLWQQHAMSDVDVILLAPAPAAQQQDEQQIGAAGSAKVEVARFPAHCNLFCNTEVLWCRVGLRNVLLPAPLAVTDDTKALQPMSEPYTVAICVRSGTSVLHRASTRAATPNPPINLCWHSILHVIVVSGAALAR